MNRTSTLIRLATVGVLIAGSADARAANITFDNSSGSLEWAVASNWATDALPGELDTADFRDGTLPAGPLILLLAGPVGPIQSLRFGTGATAANLLSRDITLSGGSIAVTGGSAGNGFVYNANNTASVTINSDLVLAAAVDISVSAPASGSKSVTFNGVVSESGGSRVFRKTQDGKLTLTNPSNSFTGGVLVQNGTLAFPNLGALGTGTTVSLGNSTNTANIAGTLQYTGTTPATLGRSIVTLTNGGTGGGVVESNVAGVTLTLAAADSVTGTGRFNFGGNGDVVVDSLLATTGNSVTKNGTGNGLLTNPSNSYTGATFVRNGTLTVTATGALGNTSGITLGDGSSSTTASPAFYTNGPVTVAKPITINAIASGTGVSTLGGSPAQVAENSIFSGSVTLNRGVQLASSTDAGHAVSFTGNITDGAAAFGLTKTSPGTVVLGGTNDYDGPTAVNEGRLLVNGVHSSATGSFTVAGGATLGGNGSIAGGITADAGSTLAPGASIGTLTAGDTVLNGNLLIELDGINSGTADALHVQALTLGSTASFTFTPLSPLDDTAYVFATYTTLDTSAFNLANVTGLPDGYTIEANYNGANQLALVSSLPEPATAATGLLGVLLGGRHRRRK